MFSTNFRFPEPMEFKSFDQVKEFVNELVRSLQDYDYELFDQDQGYIFRSGRVRPVTEVSIDYALGTTDSVVLVDASVSTRRITLPTALDAAKTQFDIKKIDTNGSTVVSVEGSGDELPVVLSGTGRPSVTVFSDGNNFWVL